MACLTLLSSHSLLTWEESGFGFGGQGRKGKEQHTFWTIEKKVKGQILNTLFTQSHNFLSPIGLEIVYSGNKYE